MAFTIEYTNSGYDLIPAGTYEAVVLAVEEKETQYGAPYISMTMAIRNDVEQSCKNRRVFHNLWKKKEPTAADQKTCGYSFKQIMSLAQALQLPPGGAYETVADMCKAGIGKPLQITVEHELGRDGRTRERVAYVNRTAYPDCKHTVAAKQEEPVIADEEIPF